MSRYKIATKTDILRYKIAKEVFGEIEDSDGIRDIPSCEIFEKCLEQHKRIAELEEQLANSIRSKFNRQEHIYCVAFGEIREFVVVAYLDNNITLCEDTTTSKLEWCDNKFLVLTKEEAETKLKELEEEDGNQ